MKTLRIISNILIGILLCVLIFSLTFIKSTKNFLEKDLILGVIKSSITNTIQEESGKLSSHSQELLDNMLNNNDFDEIIDIAIDNFDNYRTDKINFKVSDSDTKKIVSYASKYKSTIIEISGNKIKNMTDEELKKIFSSENINGFANEIFRSVEKDFGDSMDVAINIYNKATSNTVFIILLISIVFMITILLLINWSLYKWMLVVGIDLIISGLLIELIYILGLILNDIVNSVDILKKAIGEISLVNYLVWGMFEVVVGIILIIIYNIVNKKKMIIKENR